MCQGSSVVEQRTENPCVGSSILPPGTTLSMSLNKTKKIINHFRNRAAYALGSSFGQPELFYLKISDQCNFQCQHCDIWKSKKQNNLDIESWKKIISNLKTVRPNFNVVLSGGEPLLYPQFWQLIDLLKKNNIEATLNTNAFLITRDIAKKIVSSNINKVEISLYTLKAETHDNLRQTPKAFYRAMKAIEHLQNFNQSIKNKTEILIAYLINRHNLTETVDFIKHFSSKNIFVSLQSLDTNIQTLDQGTLFQNEAQYLTDTQLWGFDEDQVNRLFDQLITLKKQGFKIHNRASQLELMRQYYLGNFSQIKKQPCYCGQKNLIVSATGDLFFCFKGPRIGNIIEQSGKALLRQSGTKEILQQIKKCSKLCRIMNCNYDPSLTTKVREYMRKIMK